MAQNTMKTKTVQDVSLHILHFLNNEQYGESEMSQAVVFVYFFSFNFALTLSPQEVCQA